MKLWLDRWAIRRAKRLDHERSGLRFALVTIGCDLKTPYETRARPWIVARILNRNPTWAWEAHRDGRIDHWDVTP